MIDSSIPQIEHQEKEWYFVKSSQENIIVVFLKKARPVRRIKMYGLIAKSMSHLHLLCGRCECFIGNEVLTGELWPNGLTFVKL